jgi:dephospho-CoA kinase
MPAAEIARPYLVGLTGGIGSGKSTVSNLFAQHGVEVVDADDISRALVAPGSPALASLSERFGANLLNPDGTLHRTRLRKLIFDDAEAKAWVEALLHPLIRNAIMARIESSPNCWLLLVAPLLLESGAYDFIDRVLVVDTDEAAQVDRVTRRDATSPGDAHRIIASQMPRAARLAAADDVIDNSGSLDALAQQVAKLCKQYEEASHARHQAG